MVVNQYNVTYFSPEDKISTFGKLMNTVTGQVDEIFVVL